MSDTIFSTTNPFVVTAGRCIYCRDVNIEDLSREHVYPYALGGGIIILEASCKRHREITNEQIEAHILQNLLGPYRHRRGFPTSKKRKRPSHFRAPVVRPSGAKLEMVPLSEMPDMVSLPIPTGLPTLMSGLPPCEFAAGLRHHFNKQDLDRHLAEKAIALAINPHFNYDIYTRWFAKIAHGVAVAKFGLDGFEPLLIDIIEGRGLREAGYLMGSQIFEMQPVTDSDTGFICTARTWTGGKVVSNYLLVQMKLLPQSNSPVYSVITGRLTDTQTASINA